MELPVLYPAVPDKETRFWRLVFSRLLSGKSAQAPFEARGHKLRSNPVESAYATGAIELLMTGGRPIE